MTGLLGSIPGNDVLYSKNLFFNLIYSLSANFADSTKSVSSLTRNNALVGTGAEW